MAVILGRKGGGGGGGGGAPTGAAGGSLGGTYPNPTLSVAKQAELDAKVPKSLYDANTVLAATTDDTPAAVTMGASTILARLAAGNIKAASVAEIKTLLGIGPIFDSLAAGNVANFDATGIPATFTHLIVYCTMRSTVAAVTGAAVPRINGDSGSNYNMEGIDGVASTASASATASTSWGSFGTICGANADANAFSVFRMEIFNYASTAIFKEMTGQWSTFATSVTDTTYRSTALSGQWRSTAAINQFTVTPSSGSFVAGSRMTIYGI